MLLSFIARLFVFQSDLCFGLFLVKIRRRSEIGSTRDFNTFCNTVYILTAT